MLSYELSSIKYVLFVGHRYGYMLLNHIINSKFKPNIIYVFIEKDFEHEVEKYCNKIEIICKNLELQYTTDLSLKNQLDVLQQHSVDFVLVYGFRRLIKKEVYEKAKHGTIAMHYALLPKYRGFAPLNWAIINGEKEAGVSLFFLTNEVDDGDIIEQVSVPVSMQDDINSLLEKCDIEALKILDRQFELFENGIINRIAQDNNNASYTCSRSPDDGLIYWESDTISIYNLIRAITFPFPCAFSYLNGEIIHILDAEVSENKNYVGRIPGKVISRIPGKGIVVLTGDGSLLIKTVMDAHGNKMTADKICKSVRIKLG